MSLPRVELLVDRRARHADAVVPLVVALRTWCDPTAPDPALGAPAARLAVSVDAVNLHAALAERAVPVAVVVDNPDLVPDLVRERARVLITHRSRAAVGRDNALLIPTELIDAAAHPPLSPFVRSRWRERLGLPANLVVRVGYHDPWPADDATVAAALTVCSAAAVRGPWLLTALALGTAVVTDASEAERFGAVSGVEVRVEDPAGAPTRAEALGADWPESARLGHAARRLVETRHCWSGIARELLDRLEIARPSIPRAPLAGLQARLDYLATPTTGPASLRALHRAGDVAGSSDLLTLTGRRR